MSNQVEHIVSITAPESGIEGTVRVVERTDHVSGQRVVDVYRFCPNQMPDPYPHLTAGVAQGLFDKA